MDIAIQAQIQDYEKGENSVIQGVLKVESSLCEVGTPRSGCEHASCLSPNYLGNLRSFLVQSLVKVSIKEVKQTDF